MSEHTLFIGPVGVGKSYEARRLAKSSARGAGYVALQARELGAAGVAQWLLHRDRRGGEVLLLDEVHQLSSEGQECLCQAIDAAMLRIEGVELDILPFTLLATTYKAALSPLASRMRQVEVQRWQPARLAELLVSMGAPPDIAEVAAGRSRGTPRDAMQLIPLLLNCQTAGEALTALEAGGVYLLGLTAVDVRILRAVAMDSRVGLTRLSDYAGLSEWQTEQREDYLVYARLLDKDSRGRFLGPQGAAVLAELDIVDAASDEMLPEARRLVTQAGRVSVSYLQRSLQIGYNRAERLVKALEVVGVVTSPNSRGDRMVTQ